MSQDSEFNKIASKHLGQQGSYAVEDTVFNPQYLVPMVRNIVREERGIVNSYGRDVWHCREATFLLNNGCPVAGTLKISYPADSVFMVESKSFKLYLNSFDMCKMGDTVKEAIDNYEEQVKFDIETVLRCGGVEIKFFNEGDLYQKQFPGEYYDRIENRIDINSMQISDYHVNKNLLKVERSDVNSIDLYTNTLRSRCRHTKQKDTGSAYISMKFKQGYCIDIESLYKYIVSYRMENEFHEFCAEQIYTDLMNLENVEGVSVMLLYSRRGSLDINPIRYSHQDFYNKSLECISINTMKTEGQ